MGMVSLVSTKRPTKSDQKIMKIYQKIAFIVLMKHAKN